LLYHVSGEVTLVDFLGWQVGESPDVTLSFVVDSVGLSTEEDESEEFVEEAERSLVYELPPGRGSAPGLRRITVTNLGEEDWQSLIGAEECRDYQEGPTAKLDYQAADLTPRGGAVVEGIGVRHASLTAGWLTILDSEIDGVGHMTHLGPRRPWMRVDVTAYTELRLRWRVLGSSRWSEENPIVRVPVLEDFKL
jgi:hypothetical protein